MGCVFAYAYSSVCVCVYVCVYRGVVGCVFINFVAVLIYCKSCF